MGCGRRAPKRELVRLVARAGQLAPDPDARAPGRGAYLCPGASACWERALRRHAFARALRAAVVVRPDQILVARVNAAPAPSPAPRPPA